MRPGTVYRRRAGLRGIASLLAAVALGAVAQSDDPCAECNCR
jgi:hypothetical protein